MAAAAKYAHDRGIRFGLYDNQPEELTSESGKRERIERHLIPVQGSERRLLSVRCDRRARDPRGVWQAATGRTIPKTSATGRRRGFTKCSTRCTPSIPTFLVGGLLRRRTDQGFWRVAAGREDSKPGPLLSRWMPGSRSTTPRTCFPPMQLAALDGSWAEWQATGSVYEFRSASMGAAYWHPDAPNGGNGGPVWSAQQKAAHQESGGHLQGRNSGRWCETPTCITSSRGPTESTGMALNTMTRLRKRAWSYIFKPAAGTDTMQVKLRGLRGEARYRVSFEDGSNRRRGKDRPRVGRRHRRDAQRRTGVRIDVHRGNHAGKAVMATPQ